MSLTTDEFKRLDNAVRTIEEILGEQSLSGIISIMAGIKAGGKEMVELVFEKLENIEANCD